MRINNLKGITNMLNNSSILITGGTGSFGKTVARHLIAQDVKEVRIFSRDEEKQDAMRNAFPDAPFRYFIGDVRDRRSINSAMINVDLVCTESFEVFFS